MKMSYFAGAALLGLLSCQSPAPSNDAAPVAAPSTEAHSTPDAAPAESKSEAQNILGIDVSHFQGNVNWSEVKSAGLQFVFDKCTQGATGIDPDFKQNRQGATESGIYRGAYHFFVATDDPQTQAKHFISNYGEMVTGDLPPVLDLEEGGLNGESSKETYAKNALAWLEAISSHYGVTPIVYISPDFANEYCTDPAFGSYGLWLAQYGVDEPSMPEAWKSGRWTFWQRAQKGSISGISGDVDHDVFHGSADELKQLTKP